MRNRDATRKALSKPAAFCLAYRGLTLKTELTAERPRELLHYDPETGHFTRLVRTASTNRAGERAGCLDAAGYRGFRVDGYRYYEHRLAWLYMHGEFPVAQIDHKDGIRDNNAIKNLRPASNAQNCQNHAIQSNSSTGLTGVGWKKGRGKWQARIGVNGRTLYLGAYKKIEDAHQAYLQAKSRTHEFQPKPRYLPSIKT